MSRFIHKNDPKEIIIPLSEICNLIKNTTVPNREHRIIYWLSWLFEYEKVFHNGNLIVNINNRNYVDVKYLNDFVWIIWDIIKYYSNDDNKILIESLYKLYTNNYTRGSKKSKSNIMIYAIYVIINSMPNIKYPLQPIPADIYSRCALNSLKSNTIYLKLFQSKVLKDNVK